MTLPQYKGRIKNVSEHSGHYTYDRVAPGVTLPNEHLTGDALKAMSGDVIVYYLHNEETKKKII